MIEFGKSHIVGYASIEKETFDWSRGGLNIIQAPNGSGKTTFINALVWCLYGKPLSGSVEPWAHVRPSSYEGTKVTQTFYIDGDAYHVVRYKDYPKFKNSLLLFIEDEMDPVEGGKVDIQTKINNLLGYSYELFKNAIIFGQKLKRIISETGPNKKQVFDDAFEVTYLSHAKKLAGDKATEFKSELTKAENKHALLQERVSGKEKEISSQEEMVANYEAFKKQEIGEWKNVIKAHKRDIKKINKDEDINLALSHQQHELEIFEKDAYTENEILKKEKELTKLETNRDNLEEKAEEINGKIFDLEEQIDNMPADCASCGKPYTPSERKDAKRALKTFLKSHKELYQEKIDTIGNIRGQIKELNGTISSATKLLEDIDLCNKEISRLEKLNETISELEEKIAKDRKEITKIKERELVNNLDQLRFELLGYQNELRFSQRNLRKIGKDVATYEWLVKDPLSNAGLRAFIFNKMLDDINERHQ